MTALFPSLPNDATTPLTRSALVTALQAAPQQAADGAVGAPGIAFANDETSGLYRHADGTAVGIVFAGQEVVTISGSEVRLVAPSWQKWGPQLLFGGQNTEIYMGSSPGGYRLSAAGDWCDFWCRVPLIYKGSATGQVTITGLPAVSVGSVAFGAHVAQAIGIANAGGLPITAYVLDGVIQLFKGQDSGVDPRPFLTSDDVENAMSISISGGFAIEAP